MNAMKNVLAANIAELRRRHGLSQEKVAEHVGVSRQAVAKWEAGETVPDILNCDALAGLFEVELRDLLHFDTRKEGYGVPPRGKHIFGTVQVGERGQVVIPKRARDLFGLKHGDTLLVLADSNPGTAGIALVPGDAFLFMANQVMKGPEDEKEGGGK